MNITPILALLLFAFLVPSAEAAPSSPEKTILLGWATEEITPPTPFLMGGTSFPRIATSVADPLTATALAIEAPYEKSPGNAAILISCDLRSISDPLLEAVRSLIPESIPGLDPNSVILNATHTHQAPPSGNYGVKIDAMGETEYVPFAAPRIVAAAKRAWENRKPGGISFGLSHAVVGHNRLIANVDGKSQMYGKTDDAKFSHVEGYEDHSVNLIYTWNAEQRLTGVVINLACPSQVGYGSTLSADYWHDTRLELRRRFGKDLQVLPQCSAAGDQSPRVLVERNAERRMERLAGLNQRQIIAGRIADAVASIMHLMEKTVERTPAFSHRFAIVPIPRRRLSDEDVQNARDEAVPAKERYEAGIKEIESHPELLADKKKLREIAKTFWVIRRAKNVEERAQLQNSEPNLPVEMHVLRIGELAMATNPFELYVDYAMRIKGRSAATQTFVVQLAGSGSYLPTQRSIQGGAYGAVPASTKVGPEGGEALVNWTVQVINDIWSDGSRNDKDEDHQVLPIPFSPKPGQQLQ